MKSQKKLTALLPLQTQDLLDVSYLLYPPPKNVAISHYLSKFFFREPPILKNAHLLQNVFGVYKESFQGVLMALAKKQKMEEEVI